MTPFQVLARGLAYAFIAGDWDKRSLLRRGRAALGDKPSWLRGLRTRVMREFPEPPSEARLLGGFIQYDEVLQNIVARDGMPRVRKWFFPSDHMTAVSGPPAHFHVPAIETEGGLAAFLSLTTAELDWFADRQRRNCASVDPRLRHYHYRWVAKRSSGFRLLETPKPRMLKIQRTLLRELVAKLPPSASAHGFVPARSVLSFVAPHVQQRVVLRLDLEDFFTSITRTRVRAIFARVGYPLHIAHALAALCCVPTPNDVTRARPEGDGDMSERSRSAQRLRTAHLPQGAPTSPALSNLVALRLDRRLAGLARAAHAQHTRYADDLAFSGGPEFECGISRFIVSVAAIAYEEGFRVRYRKTRVMRAARRQQLAGLVINQRANVPRVEFDALRALLYNAARTGPTAQNRSEHPDFRAHLLGKIAWIASSNPNRGARLRALFERIAWTAEAPG